MKNTNIQWCHSTINPVMGCDGCELWPAASNIITRITTPTCIPSAPESAARVEEHLGGLKTSEIYRRREEIGEQFGCDRDGLPTTSREVVDVIRGECKCYAGILGTFRAGQKGYAKSFESPELYPGRMAKAASWSFPTDREIVDKPWLVGLPRLIFISDMGDALSRNVSFDYLRKEIVESVSSPTGARHIWLWLTKRPGRMAEFGNWLLDQNIAWPDNLVAMTTVTEQRFADRVKQLRKVPARLKGLSLEPLFDAVDLDLTDIDWVIVGGGSDVLARPFQVEWALKLLEQTRGSGTAYFLKQLGRNPFFSGKPIRLRDAHGGDWSEWEDEWRVREFPRACRSFRNGI